MRVYISGSITKNPSFKKDFARAEEHLKEIGLEPVNPCMIQLPQTCTWDDYMKVDLELLNLCDAIYMLQNFVESRGAKVELDHAIRTKKVIMFEKSEVYVDAE